MPLSAHVLLSLAKRYEVAQLFEVDKFQGLYYEQCSPFFESALFLFSRLLKRGGQTLFLRLEGFLMQDVETVDSCSPNPLQYH